MNKKQKKHRASVQKVTLTNKQIEKIKYDTYRKAVNIVSDSLEPLLKNTLKNSFGWFEGKHGDSRIKRAVKQLHEELNKIEMEVSR